VGDFKVGVSVGDYCTKCTLNTGVNTNFEITHWAVITSIQNSVDCYYREALSKRVPKMLDMHELQIPRIDLGYMPIEHLHIVNFKDRIKKFGKKTTFNWKIKSTKTINKVTLQPPDDVAL
jgi:hypothetical protein